MKRAFRIGVLCLVVVSSGAALTASAVHPSQNGSASLRTLIDRFLEPDMEPLVAYRAIRRMTASTRGGRMQAMVEARTALDPVRGFTYEIVSEEGSSVIRRKVLIAALEAERMAIGSSDARSAALTHANYEFLAVSEAHNELSKVDVRPRRKHVMLIDGSLFLDSDSADLVRVEGELSQRPSFWTRRVRIVRDYARVEGVHVPVSMRSTADVLIVGASSFSMTYHYEEINGRHVTSQ